MQTIAVGVDVVDVPRFRALLERRPRLEERLFTSGERRDANGQAERLAARFAVKEAVLKSLRSGVGAAKWHDIELVRDASGAPSVRLHGNAMVIAERHGVREVLISQSHSAMTAIAFATAQGDPA